MGRGAQATEPEYVAPSTWWDADGATRTAVAHRQQEEDDLVNAVLDAQEVKSASKNMDGIAEKIMGMGMDHDDAFITRVYRRIEEAGIEIPSVEIKYSNLTVEMDALVGDGAIMTNSGAMKKMLMALGGGQKAQTRGVKALDGATGCLKPGRLTLLIGPPSSGRSTFLKVLAGQLKPGPNTRVTGSVTYNGHTPDEFILERTAAYVDQFDRHIPNLSVEETFEFATKTQMGAGGPAFNPLKTAADLMKEGKPADQTEEEFQYLVNMVSELSKRGYFIRQECMTQLLGLAHVKETPVGGPMLRGVSGGQKKRVTSGEMLVGPRGVLMMDEISTGLDSATTFSVMNSMRTLTHAMKLTTVVTLLQPPPEVFDLFDDIIVMDAGKVVFHGPREGVVPFYKNEVGIKCASRKDPASFLVEVCTKEGQAMLCQGAWGGPGPAGADASHPAQVFVGTEEVAAKFWGTPTGRALKAEAEAPFDKSQSHPMALQKKMYALEFFEMLGVAMGRQAKLMWREPAVVKMTLVESLFSGIVLASVFFDLGNTEQESRSFLAITFMACMFMVMSNLPAAIIAQSFRAIFYKQRDSKFLSPSVYVLSQMLCQIPLSAVACMLFCLPFYFMVGYVSAVKNFLVFYVLLTAINLNMNAFFGLIASATPNLAINSAVSGIALLLLILTAGFVITRAAIPAWWIWLYWASPLPYAVRAISINEMTSSVWDGQSAFIPGVTVGEAALDGYDVQDDDWWIAVGLIYMVATYLVWNLLSVIALGFTFGKSMMAAPPEEDDDAPGMEPLAPKADVEGGPAKGGSLPFTPVSLVFRDIKYFVPAPKGKNVEGGKLQLLKGISGHAAPGVMTALMGGSGAGKTTMMDVIAGRKTSGEIQGEILVNGRPKEQRTWSRMMGYVEQTDIHSPNSTVQEALMFSARLRLPRSVTKEQAAQFVEETMALVDLTRHRNDLIGVPGESGLSLGQRKRLTMAVELVANPSVLFLDEPTSGLDSRAAMTVIRAARNIRDTQRTLMMTIHQPSIEIFNAFDALLLLKQGGHTIFFGEIGPQSASLIAYFQAIPGVVPIPDSYNPATWMLEVSGGAKGGKIQAADQDFPALFAASALFSAGQAEGERLSQAGEAVSSELHASFWTQVRECGEKAKTNYWRSPSYNFARMMTTVFIALVFGSLYWDKGTPEAGWTVGDVNNLLGCIYVSAAFMGMTNMLTVQPIIAREREVYYREKATRMYGVMPFVMSSGFVEIPYLMIQSLLFVPILYFMVGMENDGMKFLYYLIGFFLNLSFFTFFGQFMVFVTPNTLVAQVMGMGAAFMFALFNGFLMPYPYMPRGWKWVNRICPSTWTIYGLSVNQLGDVDLPINMYGQMVPAKVYLKQVFDFEFDFRWECHLIVLGCCMLFRFGSIAALKFLNWQVR